MRKLRPYSFTLVTTVLAAGATGCRTPQATPPLEASLAKGERQATPFLNREDYSDRLGLVIQGCLRNHRFAIPWIGVKGSDGSAWFVADRFQSEHRFDRIHIQVTPEDKVTASMTPYEFHASDWAILGRLFVGGDYGLEAEAIAAQIGENLADHRKTIR